MILLNMARQPKDKGHTKPKTDQSDNRRVSDLLQVLEISQDLATTTDLQFLLGQIESAAINVLGCERATVFVYDETTDELYNYLLDQDETIRFPADQGIAGWCFRQCRISNVTDAYQDSRFNRHIDKKTGYRTRNILSHPLCTHDGKSLGVLQVMNKHRGQFNDWDETLIKTFAAQCGVALNRQFLLDQFAAREKILRELKIARTIQTDLLPKGAPSIKGFDIAGWNKPAAETGGDFFDFQLLNDGRLILTIADVTGHGIGPALLAAECHALQRAAFSFLPAIKNSVTLMNRLLSDDIPDDRFVTAFFGCLNPEDNQLTFLSAGHGPILMLRASTGEFDELPIHGMPLGILSDAAYDKWEYTRFEPGDILIALTDGFFEWENSEQKVFEIEKICNIVKYYQSLSAQDIIQQVYAALLKHVDGGIQPDDLTAFIVKRC